jgi:polyhydroxybutyrate depolymerase
VAPSRHLPQALRGAVLALLTGLAAACGGGAGPAASTTTGPPVTTAAPTSSSTILEPPSTMASAATTTVAMPTTTTTPVATPLVVDGPGRYVAEVESGGLVRRFLLVVPASAPDPAPLVLVFHGLTRSPEDIEATSGMSALAEQEGFVVAYPAGTGFPRRWLAAPGQGSQDVEFVRDLVASISGAVSLDRDRVFAAGFSNGGGMAARLACDAADLVAAVGPVSAAYPGGPCDPSRPVPFVAIHGTADPIVPYEGVRGLLPAVEEVAAGWAERNGCAPDPATDEVVAGVTRLAWGGCTAGADVVLYRVAGGRHGWPGSGDTSAWGGTTDAVSASALLWEFFAGHPMP